MEKRNKKKIKTGDRFSETRSNRQRFRKTLFERSKTTNSKFGSCARGAGLAAPEDEAISLINPACVKRSWFFPNSYLSRWPRNESAATGRKRRAVVLNRARWPRFKAQLLPRTSSMVLSRQKGTVRAAGGFHAGGPPGPSPCTSGIRKENGYATAHFDGRRGAFVSLTPADGQRKP